MGMTVGYLIKMISKKGSKLYFLSREDLKKIGLSAESKISVQNNHHYNVIKKRKSRIIMKDGLLIVEQCVLIKKFDNKAKTILQTSAPICSKTASFLNENSVLIEALPVN